MAIHRIELINPCDRPNCGDFPFLEFVSFPGIVAHLQNSSVSWRILNTDAIPTSTEVYYSFNNSSLNQRVNSATASGIYSAGDTLFSIIPFAGKEGVILIQARSIINGEVFFSDIESIVVETSSISCFPEWIVDPDTPGDRVTDIYVEFTTYWVPDRIQVMGNFDGTDCSGTVLYDTGCVSTNETTRYPGSYPPTRFNPDIQRYGNSNQSLYLTRSNVGRNPDFVWHDCFSIRESDLPLGIRTVPNCRGTRSTAYAFYVLGPDFNISRIGNSKTRDLDCQEIKIPTATISYTTNDTRDEIIVFSSAYGDPCNEPIDSDKVLWRSGCVSTCLGEGPGVTGGGHQCGKTDTFQYTNDDVPFIVSVVPDCNETGGNTSWCATVTYNDGSIAWQYCGDNITVCSETWYCIENISLGTCSCSNELTDDQNLQILSTHLTQEDCLASCICSPYPSCDNFVTETISDVIAHPTDGVPANDLTVGQSGTVHTNEGAGSFVTINLPSASTPGIYFSFVLVENYLLFLQPDGADTIIDTSGQGVGKYKYAGVDGVSLTIVSDGVSNWFVISKFGFWTEGL
jgi:hypothetical protein